LKNVVFGDAVFTPSKIVCVGRNYVEHARELGNQVPDEIVFFLKPNSSISEELQSFKQEALHYEAELSFLIKDNSFCGIGLGIDLTKRVLQKKLKDAGLPWERAKTFDGAAVFSQFVPLPGSLAALNFRLLINNTATQEGHIKQMLFSPLEVLEEYRSFASLYDGDILMTGTPAGVGIINRGDIFHAVLLDGQNEILSAKWCAI